jgi:hypothetical protein
MVQQLPIGPLVVEWSEEGLLVKTPTGQYQLDAKETFDLYLYLHYHHVPDETADNDGFGMIGPTDSSPMLPRKPRDP